jgi:DNA topoisomerase-3
MAEVYGKNETQKNGVSDALANSHRIPPQAKVIVIKFPEDTTRLLTPDNKATLLTEMEGAPKLLDNEELANAVKERDLGTLTI